MSCLFETKGLTFGNFISYRDLKIPKHKSTFIVGESGKGKTTLLKLFNQTISQSSGEIFYNENNINNYDMVELRKNVSLVSQDVFLFDCSIEDNFKQFYSFRKAPPPNTQEIMDILSLCCLHMPLDKDTATMSGGERQRLYISIFLSFKPNVLLLDEPTSNLDSITASQLMENITTYCKSNGIELVVVCHDKAITEKFSENTITL